MSKNSGGRRQVLTVRSKSVCRTLQVRCWHIASILDSCLERSLWCIADIGRNWCGMPVRRVFYVAVKPPHMHEKHHSQAERVSKECLLRHLPLRSDGAKRPNKDRGSRRECYSVACTRFQAGRVFAEMVAIITRTPWLDARNNIIRFRKKLEDTINGSTFDFPPIPDYTIAIVRVVKTD
jgi:hypothetical protein